jgi:colanic acid biosynthesis glycosyl transferase WcaI
MRILVLSINYWPEKTGIAPVTMWRCEYLASRGHEVTVCTTFPYYPEWRVDERYRGRWWDREVRNGVTILRSWAFIPRDTTSLKRILFEASFLAGNLLRAATAPKPELLLVESPPLGLALTAVFLKRFWRIPFVFDVMDLQPDAAVELGMLRSPHLLRLLYSLERFGYRQANLISTLTEAMRERIIAKSIAHGKVTLFAARAERNLFLLRRGIGGFRFRHTHALEDKFLVVHAGNMGVKQGLNVVLAAAELSRDQPEIMYLLVGDGAMRPQLESKAAARKLANVRFLPLQSAEDFTGLLAATDVGLIAQQPTATDIAFPSKIVTLMAAGCPIVASVNSGSSVADILEHSGAGLVVPPEDPKSLLDALTMLSNTPAKRREMSEGGRRYAREHWDEDIILAKMESELLLVARSATGDNFQIRVAPLELSDPQSSDPAVQKKLAG